MILLYQLICEAVMPLKVLSNGIGQAVMEEPGGFGKDLMNLAALIIVFLIVSIDKDQPIFFCPINYVLKIAIQNSFYKIRL